MTTLDINGTKSGGTMLNQEILLKIKDKAKEDYSKTEFIDLIHEVNMLPRHIIVKTYDTLRELDNFRGRKQKNCSYFYLDGELAHKILGTAGLSINLPNILFEAVPRSKEDIEKDMNEGS